MEKIVPGESYTEKVIIQTPQRYEQPTKAWSLKYWLLLVAALLGFMFMAAVSGALLYKLQQRCENAISPNYKQTMDYANKEGSEFELDVDDDNYIERVVNRDAQGQTASITVINFQTRIVMTYLPVDDTCYLIGGIVEEIGTFEQSLTILKNNTYGIKHTYMFKMSDIYPVMFTEALLTDEFSKLCSKGNLYWAVRTVATDATQPRIKRKGCHSFCVNLGIVSYCYERCTK